MLARTHRRLANLAKLTLLLASLSTFGIAAAQEALPPKPEGVIRIGLVVPKVRVGSSDTSQAADAVRNILADYLQGPTIEVALLNARLPSQYTIEARQAECDYVLATTLTHRRSDLAGSVGNVLGKIANHAPYVPGADYAKTTIVTGVLNSAADFAGSVKAKDEMRLEYQLHAVNKSKPVLEKKDSRKASEDGEDLLTPLAESAAEAVGAAISR